MDYCDSAQGIIYGFTATSGSSDVANYYYTYILDDLDCPAVGSDEYSVYNDCSGTTLVKSTKYKLCAYAVDENGLNSEIWYESFTVWSGTCEKCVSVVGGVSVP